VKLDGVYESTLFFLFMLVIFMMGALMAARFAGVYIRRVSGSLGDAVQST
jgi:hypothetical protein